MVTITRSVSKPIYVCLPHSLPSFSGSFSFFLLSFLEWKGEPSGSVGHTASCLALAFHLMPTFTSLGNRG